MSNVAAPGKASAWNGIRSRPVWLIAAALVTLAAMAFLARPAVDLLDIGAEDPSTFSHTHRVTLEDPVLPPSLKEAASGELWKVWLADGYSGTSIGRAVVHWDREVGRIEWIAESGTVEAVIEVSHSPFVLVRSDRDELWVTDSTKLRPDDGVAHEGTRLLVFDITRGMSLKSETPIPNRVRFAGAYSDSMAVSPVGDAVYYLGYEFDATANGCSDSNLAACDAYFVARVGIPDGSLVARYDLPHGCHASMRLSKSGMLVLCGADATVFRLDAGLGLIDVTSFAAQASTFSDSTHRPQPMPLAATFETVDGRLLGLFADGRLVDAAAPGGESVQAVPDGSWVNTRPVQLANGILAVPFSASYQSLEIEGISLVAPDGESVRRLDLPSPVNAIGADGDSVLLLTASGILSLSSDDAGIAEIAAVDLARPDTVAIASVVD